MNLVSFCCRSCAILQPTVRAQVAKKQRIRSMALQSATVVSFPFFLSCATFRLPSQITRNSISLVFFLSKVKVREKREKEKRKKAVCIVLKKRKKKRSSCDRGPEPVLPFAVCRLA